MNKDLDHTGNDDDWPAPGAAKPGLYIVATPIGNLRDITLRAIDTLRAADVIAAEDTRVSRKLLSAYNIGGKLVSYNDHSDDFKRSEITGLIAQGKIVALISDAGSPLISDPGYRLVRDCHDLGLKVSVVPGASSVISAMQLSGLPSDAFSFIGFLPSKEKAREDVLKGWRDHGATIIAFETAPRLIDALESIWRVLGEREMAVVREITKMFEEARREKVSALIEYYTDKGPPRGEIVLVIEGAGKKAYDDADIESLIRDALASMSVKDAAAHVTAITGLPKSRIYDMALKVSRS